MKILLDCRFQKGAGPNVTLRYMLDHLVRLNTEHEFVILQHVGQPLPEYSDIETITLPSRNPLAEFLWVQTSLPKIIRKCRIDLCHSLKHVGPLFTKIPTILHLREVGHFFREGQVAFKLSLPNRIYWNHILVWGFKRATHIVGVSQDCKDVIVSKLGIPAEKVSVVNQGIDSKFRVIQDREAIEQRRKRYQLPERYIICVGNFYPHKNYDTVVRMVARLKETSRDAPNLVMVGDKSYASADFFKLIHSLGLDEDVTFTNYLEHDDLVYLYNGACLLLFPPIVASFPNPCLEAMACGIPIVASKRGAVSQITDGAALLLENPKNVDEMFAATSSVLEDRATREALREKGFKRIQDFSWDKSASKLLQLYEAVGSKSMSTAT